MNGIAMLWFPGRKKLGWRIGQILRRPFVGLPVDLACIARGISRLAKCEFTARLTDAELLSLEEARWVIDRWHLDYNHRRIHSSLDYQTPAAYAAGCVLQASATPQLSERSRSLNTESLTHTGA
jgi:hypothetical protein